MQPKLASIVATALDGIVGTLDAAILFLCNEVREGRTFDKAAAQAVMGQMRRRERAALVPNECYTPQEMRSLIACCDLTLSSRYHFCLFAALQGIPFLALRRSEKVDDLCCDLGVQGVPLSNLEVDMLTDEIASMQQDRRRAGAALSVRVGQRRERARANTAALEAVTS